MMLLFLLRTTYLSLRGKRGYARNLTMLKFRKHNTEMSEAIVQYGGSESVGACVATSVEGVGERSWYAFRVYGGHSALLLREVGEMGLESFVPMRVVERQVFGHKVVCRRPLIASLVFVRGLRTEIEKIHKNPLNGASAYRLPGEQAPAVIAEREMALFRRVTEIGAENIEVVDCTLAQGDRVRVTDGVFKGCEGCVVRIRGAKRLVVAIEGVAAVATSYIPKEFLERVE